MDATTEMFIGFLILEWMIFLPLIVIGVIGYCMAKHELHEVEDDLERLNGGH
jgi:hypothetical protein